MSDPGLVSIARVCKQFSAPEGGVITALDAVSFDVNDKEFITLLGPSGCGKTTLLRAISGFEHLDSGAIHIDGQPMTGVAAHRRPVNTVFQNYALFPHLSIQDNIGYGLDVRGCPRSERDLRVAEVLELVGMSGFERRRPNQLSGGQQQRVALARAIVNRPKLLLLDEPLSALDRKLREAMQLELKNIQHELGIAFIFVTHDQEEALTMSDRIVVMDGGRIQQIGSPVEIYHAPNSIFVAQFVGESNLFHGTLKRIKDTAVLRLANGDAIHLAHSDAPEGTQAAVVIRPEDLVLIPDTMARDDNATIFDTRIEQTVFLGTDIQVIARLDSGDSLKITIRDSTRKLALSLHIGDRVRFACPVHAPCLLPPDGTPR